MQIRESISQHTYSRLRLEPPPSVRATWLDPARRRGRGQFVYGLAEESVLRHEATGETTMLGNRVYIYDRKTSSTLPLVIAHLERLGVPYEFRDIEAYPQYREQMEKVWAESPEAQALTERTQEGITVGHALPLVVVLGHAMSGYSPESLERLLATGGIGVEARRARMQTNLIRYGAVALGVAALGLVGYFAWRKR